MLECNVAIQLEPTVHIGQATSVRGVDDAGLCPADDFQVSSTAGGAPITGFSSAGSGITLDAGDTSNGAIFEDSGGGVSCKIDGYGEFIWEANNANLPGSFLTGIAVAGGVLWLMNSASSVAMRAYHASIGIWAAITPDTHAIFVEACTQFYGTFEIIDMANNPGGCFAWFDGNVNLESKIIRAAPSTYSVWAKEPAGLTSATPRNGYVEADLIDNPGYAAVRLEGLTSFYKLWARAKEIRGRTGGASIGAIQQNGIGGKLYIEAEKIDNISDTAKSPAIYVTAGEAWIRAQKITTNLNADMALRYAGQAVTCDL